MPVTTVGDIWVRVKQRADIEKAGSSGFVSDDEGRRLIQLGTAQLQNLVMNSYEYWISKYVLFQTVTNQEIYPFTQVGMGDFYKLLGIGLTSPPTNPTSPATFWEPLEHFDMYDLNTPATSLFTFSNGYLNGMKYKLMTDNKGYPSIVIKPCRSQASIGVYYVPRPPQFANLVDEIPPWIMPGWEEYIVAFAAWMIGAKERSGVQHHKEIWQMVSEEIKNFAPNRDSFQPLTVIRANGGMWGSPWSGSYGAAYGDY